MSSQQPESVRVPVFRTERGWSTDPQSSYSNTTTASLVQKVLDAMQAFGQKNLAILTQHRESIQELRDENRLIRAELRALREQSESK